MDPNIFMLMLGAAVDTAPSGFAELAVAFVTLCVLEIVLGIDNVIFISILAGKLPPEQQPKARFIGLSLAMITRVLLLMSIAWMARLTYPLFSIFQHEVSGRDLILIIGGIFLVWKSTHEIHQKLEGEEGHGTTRAVVSFNAVITQIILLDIVFSLDSVITAVGMVNNIPNYDRGSHCGGHLHDGFRRTDQWVCRSPPHYQDARAQLPPAYRGYPHCRRIWPAYCQGLHLFCDGLFRVRGSAQHQGAQRCAG